MREDTAYLRITSWVGTFGIHYYGDIWFNGKRKELNWVPPENQRKMLNDYEIYKFSRLKKGELTIKFLREGDLETEAVRQYKMIFPEAKRLVKGNPMSIYDEFPEKDILEEEKSNGKETRKD